MAKKKRKKIKKEVKEEKVIKKVEASNDTKKEKEKVKKEKVVSKKTRILFIILGILLFLLIGFLIYYKVTSKFRYNEYEKKVETNYGDKYQIKAPIVCYGNKIKCHSIKPVIKGKVDTKKMGKYEIEFNYKYKKNKLKLKQRVEVKDLKEPEIVLNDEEVKVCPNGKIIKLELNVNDNLDGDITDTIKTTLEEKELVIEVEDSSGNKASKKVDVEPKDEEKPVITINGKKDITVIKGVEYKDQGASVVDNCDDNIQLKTEGSVDTNTIGIYKITYSATDKAGNNSLVTRTISVKERPVGTKVVYLTFDDGPGGYTQKLLDILDKYNVKATFFVTNQFPKYQYLIGEEARRGHAVAVHSLTHKWGIYDSVEAYMADFEAMNDIIEQQTGSRTKLFRFPGGSSNTVYCGHNKTAVPDIINVMNEKGNVYFDWNLSSGDAGGTTSTDRVVANVTSKMRHNSVVLQHDIKGFSVNAVERIIQYGLNNGFVFKALDVNSPTAHHGVHICK